MSTVGVRQLNRWTLARQMLLERAELDVVTAIERLAGMQAQYSPSPYIGLWSRLQGFVRDELESAVMEERVVKATLMRVTLHLVSARDFVPYRVAAPIPSQVFVNTTRFLQEIDVDVAAVHSRILADLREQPLTRLELMALARRLVPAELPDWAAWGTVALCGRLIPVPEGARFGQFSGVKYRVAPQAEHDTLEAFRHIISAYLSAFGPASRADLSQWSGQQINVLTPALNSLELLTFRSDDGRTLLDLPDAPRPDEDGAVPVRFLPKWDNLLLAYQRRERVLPEELRKTVIRKNGDVLPTFLVDGVVAGTWEAPLRGKAIMKLTALQSIPSQVRREIEAEGERLLAWLRPETERREIGWTAA
ncbi:MAG TPA: winged helix DNA-binding domain-containing protein [Chloroflexota bacterium]